MGNARNSPGNMENCVDPAAAPGGSTCRIEAKDIAYCTAADADGDTPHQVCGAVSFYSDDASNGDTCCIGLQPELRDAFLEEADSFELPLCCTFYEKRGTGYVRAVGAGILRAYPFCELGLLKMCPEILGTILCTWLHLALSVLCCECTSLSC